MILTNGRGEKTDMGPRRTFAPSLMKPIVSYSDTPGGWTGTKHAQLFAAAAEKKEKREKEKVGRPAHYNVEMHTFLCARCGKQATRFIRAKYCSDKCLKKKVRT